MCFKHAKLYLYVTYMYIELCRLYDVSWDTLQMLLTIIFWTVSRYIPVAKFLFLKRAKYYYDDIIAFITHITKQVVKCFFYLI